MKVRHALLPAMGLLLALPLVSAAPFDAIAEAMGLAWNAIGALFSFEYVSESTAIREGILKFLIFILILRVVQVALSMGGQDSLRGGSGGRPFDRKTAGIIGFVVAAITVIFSPNTILVTGIIGLLVPVALIGGLVYYGFMVLKGDWLKNLLGAILLFITAFITMFAIDLFTSPGMAFANPTMNQYILTILNVILAVVLILFIVKLLMIFLEGDGLFRGGWPWGGRDGAETPEARQRRETPPATPEQRRRAEEEAHEEAPDYTYLDPTQTGNVRFRVVDADGNPIQGARIIMAPNRARRNVADTPGEAE